MLKEKHAVVCCGNFSGFFCLVFVLLFFFLSYIDDLREMKMKHVCKFTYSIPLTSWIEALLLLLLVDVLPLSRLAGLEAKWKIRRHHDEQSFSR